MLKDLRHWLRSHLVVAVSFVVGMTSGFSILALAYFSKRNEIAARMLRYGIRATGHADIEEDLLWFLCGIVIGATAACLAWWRDNKARSSGLEKEDILNRLVADPAGKGKITAG